MAKGTNIAAMSVRRTWRERLVLFGPAAVITLAAIAVAYHFVQPAPPRHIVLATGPADGAYAYYGRIFRDRLAREGIDVTLESTHGAVENIERLRDHKADVAFVQGGAGENIEAPHLRSLASLYFEPVWVFVRTGAGVSHLADLRGHRVAIDAEGSGTRAIALALLADNGIGGGDLSSARLGGDNAARALHDSTVDAAFFVVAARAPVIHDLLGAPGIRLLSIDRAAAYRLRHRFLTAVTVPQGAADLAADLPRSDTTLLAAGANLVVRDNFHPALADLLLREARDIFGEAGLFEEAGQFPSRQYLEYPISDEARTFFNSGPSLLQRYLPFGLANSIDRFKVLLLPLITLVYPFAKIIPPAYDWRMRSRINRWYNELQAIETSTGAAVSREELARRLRELDRIESSVQRIAVPVSYGGPLYTLRLHIALLRSELREAMDEASPRQCEAERVY